MATSNQPTIVAPAPKAPANRSMRRPNQSRWADISRRWRLEDCDSIDDSVRNAAPSSTLTSSLGVPVASAVALALESEPRGWLTPAAGAFAVRGFRRSDATTNDERMPK